MANSYGSSSSYSSGGGSGVIPTITRRGTSNGKLLYTLSTGETLVVANGTVYSPSLGKSFHDDGSGGLRVANSGEVSNLIGANNQQNNTTVGAIPSTATTNQATGTITTAPVVKPVAPIKPIRPIVPTFKTPKGKKSESDWDAQLRKNRASLRKSAFKRRTSSLVYKPTTGSVTPKINNGLKFY